jgi:hypothetical protein
MRVGYINLAVEMRQAKKYEEQNMLEEKMKM